MILSPENQIPENKMGDSVEFCDYFNLEDIQHIQDSFADVHQIGSVITLPDGNPVTRSSNFAAHDSGIIGLMHAFASVTCGGKHIAIWHIWKAREEEPEQVIPDMSLVKFQKIAKILDILANEVSEKASLKMQLKLHDEVPGNLLAIELEKKRLLDEKQRADKILSEQSSILRNILDNSPVGIWMMDETGRMKFVNKTYCDAIGIPECDFLAVDHYSVLYDNDTSQRCIDSDKAALESSIPHTSHETVMFTDGQFHDLEIVKNRITDVHGNTLGLIGISLDITEQKRAKEELEEKKEKYRGLSEASFDAIFISEKGFCTEQNQTAEKMFGYSSSEAIGRYGTDWIVPEDRDQVMQNMLKGTEEPYEAIALKKDGTTFPCMIRGKMMFYKGKNMRVTSLSDITEFKRAQNALRDSDLRYRSLFQNTPSGIMLIDEYGIILEANEAIAKTTGYAYNELVGSDVRMLTAIENTYLVAENIQRIISGERTEQEVMSKRKDGTFCTLLLREVAILLPNGRPGVLSVSNDISDRKKVEAANKELESFSYSVSHDLKAPLRHISGFIHLLLENKSTEFSETDLGYINFISNSANEMGCLIDAILSFSRLNSSTLQFSTIHSSSLVNEVINFFKPEIQNRTIEFILESLPDIKGDIALIRQVWTNLISNAIKYTGKKSEALIVIGSFPEEKMITFFIRDNGAGFKMAKSGKLFGVFQRLHKANDFEGIGIGLANVNRIIMRHGGNCRAEGDPGNGATFYFSLPIGSVS